jgi:L-threonylcarbamoyladenylate synthase
MPITQDIAAAIAVLQRGGLVAIPTETVYGLAAHALDPLAVARIFEAKNRPHFDPLIVHIADADQLSELVTHVPPIARRLMDAFWPGPLTLVLPKTDRVPDLVTAGLPSVAVRMPDHPVARELLRRSRLPLAAPSANLFGRISPTTAQHVVDQLADRIDLILDGGPCRVGVESTILHVGESGPLKLLRPGGIPVEAIESLTGPLETVQSNHDDAPQLAPGMLTSHYAPRKPTTLVASFEEIADKSQTGILSLTPPPTPKQFGAVEALSPNGDLSIAAANLFAALRRLDASDVKQIAVKLCPEVGLGRAINDRLRRAAT